MPFSLRSLLHNVFPGSFKAPEETASRVPSLESHGSYTPPLNAVPPPPPEPPQELSCFIKGVIKSIETQSLDWDINTDLDRFENHKLAISVNLRAYIGNYGCWVVFIAGQWHSLKESDHKALDMMRGRLKNAKMDPAIHAMEQLGCPTNAATGTEGAKKA